MLYTKSLVERLDDYKDRRKTEERSGTMNRKNEKCIKVEKSVCTERVTHFL